MAKTNQELATFAAKRVLNAINTGAQVVSLGVAGDLLERYKFITYNSAESLNKDYAIVGSFNKELYKNKGIDALNTLKAFMENSRAANVDALKIKFPSAGPPPAADRNLSDTLTPDQKNTINQALFTNQINDDVLNIIHDIEVIRGDLNNNDSNINPISMASLINGYHKTTGVLKTRLDADLAAIDRLFNEAKPGTATEAAVVEGAIRTQLLHTPTYPCSAEQITEIQKNMQAAVQKKYDDQSKIYSDAMKDHLKELDRTTKQAYDERQIILALYEKASDADKAKFLQPGVGAGIVVGNPGAAQANTLKLKSLDELLANVNGQPATITTLTGLTCTYNQATDTLSITIPRTLFSLSFYHTSIDSQITADFDLLARTRKALQMKQGVTDGEFKPIIGKTNKYFSPNSQNPTPLSEKHKIQCRLMIQAGLNAGYPLEKITVTCHGRSMKAPDHLHELGINQDVLEKMRKKTELIQTTKQQLLKSSLENIQIGTKSIKAKKQAEQIEIQKPAPGAGA